MARLASGRQVAQSRFFFFCIGLSELLSLARFILSLAVMTESTEVFAASVAILAESAAAKSGTATSAFAFCFWAETWSEVASSKAEMQICDNLKFTFSILLNLIGTDNLLLFIEIICSFLLKLILFLFQFIENVHNVLQFLFIAEWDADFSLALGRAGELHLGIEEF